MTPSGALATTEPTEIPSPVVPYVETNPTTVLLDERLRDRFFAEIEETVSTAPVDLTTDKGRKEVAALAYKISRTKTAIDDAGKALTEEWRAKTKVVNDARAIARDRLDDLRDKARAPLTEWESAEKARIQEVEDKIGWFEAVVIIPAGSSAYEVAAKLDSARACLIDEEVFREFTTRALAGRKAAIEALEAGLARIRQEEADRAELAKLRAEREERERVERERIAAEEAAKAAAEAEAARKADVERLAAEAADKARRDAEERAEREKREAVAEAERKAQEQIAAERAENERKLAVAEAERRAVETAARVKAEAEEAIRLRQEQEAAAQKAADERRIADRAHRSAIMSAAKEGLMEHGKLNEAAAKTVVLAIVSNLIPNVGINF